MFLYHIWPVVEDCSSFHFSSTEPNFTLALESIVGPQTTSERTELACRVTNITHLPPGDRLGVNWEHTALPGNLITPSTRKVCALHLSSCVLIFPTTCRNRRWSSDITYHWFLGWPGQPVTRVDVFRQAEEWRGLSYQNPAQHFQTSVSPNTGNTVDLFFFFFVPVTTGSLMDQKWSLILNKC